MATQGSRRPPSWTMQLVTTALLIAAGGSAGRVSAQGDEAPLPGGEMITRIYHVADLVIPIRMTGRTVDMSGAELEPVFVHPVDVAQFGPNDALARAITPHAPGLCKVSLETMPDFEPLANLVTELIAKESWRKAGGPCVIQASESNRALVITQTQEAHEQIEDLLVQVRRVFDLQVVIETRFLTAPDDFFDEAGLEIEFRRGVETNGVDTDLAFTQGGLPDDLAELDFAMLPPRRKKALMEAVRENSDANLLAAPRISLFNGQRVSVGPASMGDHPPANVWLSVAATVMIDHRNVRLMASPTISETNSIGAVKPQPLAGPVIATSANLPGDASPNPDSPMVCATIPGGCTLLVDGGVLPAASTIGKARGKRLFLLVTPRIVLRADE